MSEVSCIAYYYYNTGYRVRWFRLKGNLLFYFKVDDTGDWKVCLLLYGLLVCITGVRQARATLHMALPYVRFWLVISQSRILIFPGTHYVMIWL